MIMIRPESSRIICIIDINFEEKKTIYKKKRIIFLKLASFSLEYILKDDLLLAHIN